MSVVVGEKKRARQPVLLIDPNENKHLLVQSINTLATRIQQSEVLSDQATLLEVDGGANFVILKLENEALDYLEQVVFNVLNSILNASLDEYQSSPDSNFIASYSQQSTRSVLAPAINNTTSNPSTAQFINDLREAEFKTRQVLPRSYADEVCSKANTSVEKSRDIQGSTRILNWLKNKSTYNDLDLTFPVEKINQLLNKIYSVKFDSQVAIFLTSVLETIVKDILHLSTCYVRHLNKYSIGKEDIHTAVNTADYKLARLLNLTGSIMNRSLNDLLDLDEEDGLFEIEEDDDDTLFSAFNHSNSSSTINTFNVSNSSRNNNYQDDVTIQFIDSASLNSIRSDLNAAVTGVVSSVTGGGESDSSSTICPDSSSVFSFQAQADNSLKYYNRVKDFLLEQSTHLSDLNILRRIFMYLFKKFYTQSSSSNIDQLIEDIFGNINDVYEVALRLTDLIDDCVSSLDLDQTQSASQHSPLQGKLVLVGQYFWELAEGDEFDVYLKYSTGVTNFNKVSSSLKTVLTDSNVRRQLAQASPGLVDISRYLLPRLLFGPVYHALYLYETVEYLSKLSTDEEDKQFLLNTLDTLKRVKLMLKELDFISSKQKPIEMSFRLFQPHQFHEKISSFNSTDNQSNSTVVSASSYFTRIRTLVSNAASITDKKWKEIENNVEGFKLSSSFSPQANTLRYAYLFEGSLTVCKQTSNTKTKQSRRYVFLFDGLLIFAKRVASSGLNTTSSNISNSSVASISATFHQSSGKSYRFKQTVALDKYRLVDRTDDDRCFELNNTGFTADQPTESILLIADSMEEKYNWMSMLCYTQYKLTMDRLLQTMTEEHNRNNQLPVPPRGYVFDQPDTDDTILFDLSGSPDTKAASSQAIIIDSLNIKAATIEKLVERLTHHLYLNPKFNSTFLMFYREFSTPGELLNLLSLRYDVPDLDIQELDRQKYNFNSGEITERELLKRYRREYQQPIRLKVINLIKHWIEGYYEDDFATDADNLEHLKELIFKIGETNKRFEQVLLKTLQKKALIFSQKRKKQKTLTSSTSSSCSSSSSSSRLEPISCYESSSDYFNVKNIFKYSGSSRAGGGYSSNNQSSSSSRSSSTSTNEEFQSSSSPNFDEFYSKRDNYEDPNSQFPPFETHLEKEYPYELLTIHPLEFARQVTLMEEEIFKAIKPSELITIGWNKPTKKYQLSPNVSKLINLSNKFTYWYVKCMVDTYNLDERVAVVQRLLEISHYFYEMNNYSGLREIYAALENCAIVRLKATRDKAGLEEHKMYARFKELFENHDKGYLERLKKCSPPCIPFIGTHLTMIYKKHEHNKQLDKSSDKSPTLINFAKYKLLVEFVTDLLQYQSASYKFRRHEQIRSYLLDDMENYFEKAQVEFNNRQGSQSVECDIKNDSTPASIVDAWLFDRSKQLEPNDIHRFPRLRNYPLKAPLPSALNTSANRTPVQQSRTMTANSRSISSTRLGFDSEHKRAQKPGNNQSSLLVTVTPTNIVKIPNSKRLNLTPFDSKSAVVSMNSKNASTRESPSLHFDLISPPLTDAASSSSISSLSPLAKENEPEKLVVRRQQNQQYASLLHKLSLTSADGGGSSGTSSSAPNSPPPNYDEVFDQAALNPSTSILASSSLFGINQHARRHASTSSTCPKSPAMDPRGSASFVSNLSEMNNNTPNLTSSNSSIAAATTDTIGGARGLLSGKSNTSRQGTIFSFNDDVLLAAASDVSDLRKKNPSCSSISSIEQLSPIYPANRMPGKSTLPPAPVYAPPAPPDRPPTIQNRSVLVDCSASTSSISSSSSAGTSTAHLPPVSPPKQAPLQPPAVPPRPKRK